MTDPVGHGFDQDGFVLLLCDLPGGLGGVVHGEHVVAVDPDGGHAVGGAAHRDAVPAVLLAHRCGDCVTVIATKMFLYQNQFKC